MSCTNIEDLVSLWDLIALGSIYGQKKHIEESFMMVVEANNYVKQFQDISDLVSGNLVIVD